MKVIIGLFIGMMLMVVGAANAATFNGGFTFGSDYNLTPGNNSLLTSSGVTLTNSITFAGNSATGDFSGRFGNAHFDIAFNDSIPLNVGNFNINNFLYNFTGINLFSSNLNLGLAVDLLSIGSINTISTSGLTLFGQVLIRDLTNNFSNTLANIEMEFSESIAVGGQAIRSMSGNIQTIAQSTTNVPEPSSLVLMGLAFLGYLSRKKIAVGTMSMASA